MNQHYYQSKRMVLIPIVLFILLLSQSISFAQGRGVISGTVTDSTTSEGLFGTNVWLENTSLGVATGIEGEYRIPQIPAGTYTVIFRYIGYQQKRISVSIKEGQTIQLNVKLTSQALEGQEVVVTAQARGQKEAINQQLSSPTIVNIVSADKIRQLPDDNASTALSRLPGVSLMNGDQVVIRGVEAKYNQVLVNGIPLPSTSMNDRSSNLGFISSNMLSGIEVIKAITPDMDANTLGGVVNLRLANAQPGFHADALAQGNYDRSNRAADNYKFWISLSDRFFDDKLGVFIQGNTDRTHGGNQSASLGIGLSGLGSNKYGQGTYDVSSASFNFGESITINSGGSLILDYKLPDGKIIMQNTYAGTVSDNRGQSIGLNFNGTSPSFNGNHNKYGKDVWLSALQIDYNFGDIKLETSASYSYTDQYTIANYGGGIYCVFNNVTKSIAPWGYDSKGKVISYENESFNIPLSRAYQLYNSMRTAEVDSATLENQMRAYNNTFRQHLTNFSADVTVPVNLTTDIRATFKGGGKLVRSYRFSDSNTYHTLPNEDDTYATVKNFFPGRPRNGGNRLRLTDVIDRDFVDKRGQYFLEDEYSFKNAFYHAIDYDILDDWWYTSMNGWSPQIQLEQSVQNDFTGSETFAAGYLMGTINLTQALTVIGGARYESYNMQYGAQFTYVTHSVQGDAISTAVGTLNVPWEINNVNRTDINWFPNAQVKYKVNDWADIRVAYTTGITRPDYQNILPKIVETPKSSFTLGNPKVRPAKAQNLDVILSIYNNELGLLTVGGFYKKITDVQYVTSFYYSNLKELGGDVAVPDSAFLASYNLQVPLKSDQINTTLNSKSPGYVRGIEIDWQTHFWYLPEPFNSLVLNANYTKSGSNMDYLIRNNYTTTVVDPVTRKPKPVYVTKDTVFTGRLAQQANDVINIALGVDYKDFSGRISFNMRGDVLNGVGGRPEETSTTDNIYRWDFTLKQNLPIKGLSIALNGTNIFHNVVNTYRNYRLNPSAPITKNLVSVSYSPTVYQLNVRYSL